MAALQGFLLKYKESHLVAMENIASLRADPPKADIPVASAQLSSSTNPLTADHQTSSSPEIPKTKAKRASKVRPVKPLTAAEVDKMVFNPQKDWDKNL